MVIYHSRAIGRDYPHGTNVRNRADRPDGKALAIASMSLAGRRSSLSPSTPLAVAVDDASRICIPTNGSPSTHILEPDAPRLSGSVAKPPTRLEVKQPSLMAS
jgi:hypothetical protein